MKNKSFLGYILLINAFRKKDVITEVDCNRAHGWRHKDIMDTVKRIKDALYNIEEIRTREGDRKY